MAIVLGSVAAGTERHGNRAREHTSDPQQVGEGRHMQAGKQGTDQECCRLVPSDTHTSLNTWTPTMEGLYQQGEILMMYFLTWKSLIKAKTRTRNQRHQASHKCISRKDQLKKCLGQVFQEGSRSHAVTGDVLRPFYYWTMIMLPKKNYQFVGRVSPAISSKYSIRETFATISQVPTVIHS